MSKKVKLLSICKPKQYKTISKNKLVEDGKYLVYGANGVIGKSNKYTHENPTLMVTCRGATCGSLNISKPFSYINGNAMAFDSIDKNFDLMYLYYYLSSRGFNDAISGTAQPQITRENLKNIDVLELSLEKQRKIAKTLDKANELIELRKESITKLDALAKSIFIDMFGDPVSNPKGWELVTFDKLIEIKPKSIKPENIQELDKYVGLENIEKDLGNLINIKNAINEDLKSNKFHFDENTILYGKLRPYLNKVALPSFSGVCSTDILPIKVIRANKIFVVFIIRHNSFVDIMTSRATGANLPRVNKSDLLTQKVFNPPIELQNKFAKIIEKIEEQKSLYEKELELLQNNFDALLQKSFQE